MKKIVIALAALVVSMTPALADFGAGFAAYSRGDYEIAVEEWRDVADEGDVKAQVGLGFMYEKGLGVPQDFTKAVRWYRLAADQNDSIAQYNLGVMYGNGTGVLQDYVEAHRLFSLAATRGNEDAKNSLSYIEKLMTPSQLAQAESNSVEVEVASANGPAAEPAPVADPAPVAVAAPVAAPAAPVPAPAPPIQAAKPRPATPLVNTAKAPPPQAPAVPPVAEPAKLSPQIAAAPQPAEVTPTADTTPAVAKPVLAVAATPTVVADPVQAPQITAPKTTARNAPPVAPQNTETVQIAAKTPAPKVSPSSADGPWQVHLVSLQNGNAVDDEWNRLLKLHPNTLQALSLNVQEIDIPEKGLFFRLLAGSFDSEATAQAACAAIKAEGQYCRPIRR